MSTSQKISLSGIMCLSVFMIITALTRLIGLVATTHKTNKGTAPIWGTFWMILEACIAVIMAFFLTFRSVFVIGNRKKTVGIPVPHSDQLHGSDTFWERLLSRMRFRSKSLVVTAEEGHMGENCSVGGKPRKKRSESHLISMVNITRSSLAFSRLQTLFRSETGTQFTGEAPRSTIDISTEFDLRDLDYHHMIRQDAPSSAGIGSIRT